MISDALSPSPPLGWTSSLNGRYFRWPDSPVGASGRAGVESSVCPGCPAVTVHADVSIPVASPPAGGGQDQRSLWPQITSPRGREETALRVCPHHRLHLLVNQGSALMSERARLPQFLRRGNMGPCRVHIPGAKRWWYQVRPSMSNGRRWSHNSLSHVRRR